MSCCCIAGIAEGGEEGGTEPSIDQRYWDMSSQRDILDKTDSISEDYTEHAHQILKRWTITWLQREQLIVCHICRVSSQSIEL